MNGGLHRRDQIAVAKLTELLEGATATTLKAARARARSLPTMLRRHGPISVLLFLDSKGGSDGDVGRWLVGGLRALVDVTADDPKAYAGTLSRLPLEEYLIHWRSAVELATWLKRMIDARTRDDGSAAQGDAVPGPAPDSPAANGTTEAAGD